MVEAILPLVRGDAPVDMPQDILEKVEEAPTYDHFLFTQKTLGIDETAIAATRLA